MLIFVAFDARPHHRQLSVQRMQNQISYRTARRQPQGYINGREVSRIDASASPIE
jgi:hypothetical protein